MALLRSTMPPSRFNNDLDLNSRHWDILIRNSSSFVGETYQNPLITMRGRVHEQFTFEFFNHAFLYLITETLTEHPHVYFTEKTWKALASKTPFMIVGTRHSLKKLQEFGFKTFRTWWSEEYDNLTTTAERTEAIVKEIKKLSELPKDQLATIRREIEPIVVHNHAHLKTFIASDLDNIRKIL